MKFLPVSQPSEQPVSTAELSARAGILSALADGDPDAAARGCALWRDDEDARRTWHAYHLIGDVMRSDDLACQPGRDAAFLAGIRQRLAAEPVVLAPQPVRRRQPWLVPAAAAAGFAVVAGVLVVSRVGLPGAASDPAQFATASGPRGGVTQLASGNAQPLRQAARGADAVFIRDARLDEYLRVHQAARGGVAVAAPGGALRSVEVTVPASSGR